jgi:hypothetical protein
MREEEGGERRRRRRRRRCGVHVESVVVAIVFAERERVRAGRRDQRPPLLYVAHPSKSGWGVDDGDAAFLSGGCDKCVVLEGACRSDHNGPPLLSVAPTSAAPEAAAPASAAPEAGATWECHECGLPNNLSKM